MSIQEERHPGPRVWAWPDGVPVPMIRDDVALAVFWCRLGRLRPQRDAAFYEAEDAGLLTHHDVWDATSAGEAYLARAIQEAPYV